MGASAFAHKGGLHASATDRLAGAYEHIDPASVGNLARVVMSELAAFDPGLAARPQILVANKADLLGRDKSRLTQLKRLAARKKLPFFVISALKEEGLRPLVKAMADLLAAAKPAAGTEPA